MSLIIDVLKRLEGKGRRTGVHPALLRRKEETRDRKRYLFLAFSIFFALTALGAYFVSDRILSKEAYQEEIGPPPENPTEEAPPEPPRTVEPIEKTAREEEAPKPKIERETQPAEKRPERIQVSKRSGIEKITSDILVEKPSPAVKRKAVSGGSFPKLAYLADKAFREGDLVRSKEYYERALALRKDPKVANNLMVVYVRLGLYERARSLLFKIGEEDLAYTYLVELAGSGRVEEALKEGKGLKYLDRRGRVLFALGYIHELIGNIEEALRHYEAAYKKNPKDPYVAVNYARLLEAKGDLRKAYSVYTGLNLEDLDPKIKLLVERRIGYLRNLGF